MDLKIMITIITATVMIIKMIKIIGIIIVIARCSKAKLKRMTGGSTSSRKT